MKVLYRTIEHVNVWPDPSLTSSALVPPGTLAKLKEDMCFEGFNRATILEGEFAGWVTGSFNTSHQLWRNYFREISALEQLAREAE